LTEIEFNPKDCQRIRTAYLYPDGDNFDLFCKPQDDGILVSDLGETMRWWRMQTVSPRRSPKQNALIEDACLTHGVTFYKGMLMAQCCPGEELAAVISRVAQAALRILDSSGCLQTPPAISDTDELSDLPIDHQR
jgi:hypothetical protein